MDLMDSGSFTRPSPPPINKIDPVLSYRSNSTALSPSLGVDPSPISWISSKKAKRYCTYITGRHCGVKMKLHKNTSIYQNETNFSLGFFFRACILIKCLLFSIFSFVVFKVIYSNIFTKMFIKLWKLWKK